MEKFTVKTVSDVAIPKDKEFFGYPTMVRLNVSGERNGTLLATFARYGTWKGYDVYESCDDGESWHYLSSAVDNREDKILNAIFQPCLFEIPKDMGKYKAGTLILGGCTNFVRDGIAKTAIVFYISEDSGKSWTQYMDLCYGGTAPDKLGVWEPFFIFDEKTDRLYCYYSDESNEANDKNGAGAQKLVFKYSTDMKTWVGKDNKTGVTDDPFIAINSSTYNARPGMISIAKMGNGEYFMTYELCLSGENNGCPIYYKKTTNLAEWTDTGDHGKPIQTANGYTFGSAPWCAWTPAGGECGTLVVVAHHNNNSVRPITLDGNGKVYGTDMLISLDYGETFIPFRNPIPYYTFEKTAYSPFVGFSADGNTLYYLNNPPDSKQSYQSVVFKALKIW